MNDDSVKNSDLDFSKPTKFVTHGWLSSGSAESCMLIKDAYLKFFDYNVIVMDWSPISKTKDYVEPAHDIKPIAEYYASFVDYLIEKGLKPEDIHLIGHSLGAHVSGVCGKLVTKGKIGRITG